MKVVVRTIPVLPEEGFVRLRQVLQVIPVGKTSFYAGMKANPPLYPKPVKIGPRTVAWRVTDIRKTLDRLGAGQGAT